MTAPFNRLLLATERTEFDIGAERVAIDLAVKCGQPLWAVMPLVTTPEFEIQAPELAEKAEAEASAKLDEFEAAAAAKGVEVHGMIRLGDQPYSEIVEEAVVRKADLIILRRRSKRSFLANILFGELTHAVIGNTDCDVLTVPRAAQVWSKGILLATDGSANSERATALAGAIAVRCDVPLTIVSVAEDNEDHAKDEAAVEATVERAVAIARATGAQVSGRVVTDGKPHKVVLAVAEETGADLIVIGRRGLGKVKRMMVGSTSEQVVGSANCAVLVIQEEA